MALIKGDDAKNKAPITSAFFRSELFDKNLLGMIADFGRPVAAQETATILGGPVAPSQSFFLQVLDGGRGRRRR